MKLFSLAATSIVLASTMPITAAAQSTNDFPTTTRVEYVLECMHSHSGRNYESFYKCACVIDEIAKQASFDEYAEISTASKYRRLGGERGAEFRDPEQVDDMAKKYKAIEGKAADVCFLK